MLRPLGLPVGSVRALLLFGLSARAILDLRSGAEIVPWLATALVVAAAAYFSARSTARQRTATSTPAGGEPLEAAHPLFLPAGTVRTLFLLAIAYGAWLWWKGRDVRIQDVPVAWVLLAFVLGAVLRWILAKARRPEDPGTGLFWHLEALVALACAGGLVALAATGREAEVANWVEPLLASGVAFYFGTR